MQATEVRRGRPRINPAHRMVPLMVMVPPGLKAWYERRAKENGHTLSEQVRLILNANAEPVTGRPKR